MSLTVVVAVVGVFLLFCGRFILRLLFRGVKIALLGALVVFVLNYEGQTGNLSEVATQVTDTKNAVVSNDTMLHVKEFVEQMHRKFSAYEVHVELRHNDDRRY